jgi:hypothetical protein
MPSARLLGDSDGLQGEERRLGTAEALSVFTSEAEASPNSDNMEISAPVVAILEILAISCLVTTAAPWLRLRHWWVRVGLSPATTGGTRHSPCHCARGAGCPWTPELWARGTARARDGAPRRYHPPLYTAVAAAAARLRRTGGFTFAVFAHRQRAHGQS